MTISHYKKDFILFQEDEDMKTKYTKRKKNM